VGGGEEEEEEMGWAVARVATAALGEAPAKDCERPRRTSSVLTITRRPAGGLLSLAHL
jgi:hypothetical protein